MIIKMKGRRERKIDQESSSARWEKKAKMNARVREIVTEFFHNSIKCAYSFFLSWIKWLKSADSIPEPPAGMISMGVGPNALRTFSLKSSTLCDREMRIRKGFCAEGVRGLIFGRLRRFSDNWLPRDDQSKKQRESAMKSIQPSSKCFKVSKRSDLVKWIVLTEIPGRFIVQKK